MNIKKGDQVKILQGKDRGKTGSVLQASPSEDRIVVEGLNLFKKRIRPKRQGEKGQTVMAPKAMHISKVAVVCPNCKKAIRVGHRLEGDKKVRVCKKCGATL